MLDVLPDLSHRLADFVDVAHSSRNLVTRWMAPVLRASGVAGSHGCGSFFGDVVGFGPSEVRPIFAKRWGCKDDWLAVGAGTNSRGNRE